MTGQPPQRHPTEINLHAKPRLLSIRLDDGARLELPRESLRGFLVTKLQLRDQAQIRT